ncbi:MAG: pilus assembly protein [Pirellulales bacterium]|nr:pilus assembly protein [Pirellulales bacterium]
MKGRSRRLRRGVAVVEGAIILPLAIGLLLVLLDLGIATARYNALGHASRRVARAAAVRGADISKHEPSIGPAAVTVQADDAHPLCALARRSLPLMNPEDVAVTVSWPDGDNNPCSRIRVELQYIHQPIVPLIAVWGDLDLRAASTMRVVN